MDSATSGGVRAPRSSPAGFRIAASAGHAAFLEQCAHRRPARPRGHEPDVGHAALQDRFERLFVVVPLRDDDRREIRAARDALPQDRLERLERNHRHTERRGLLLDVATLAAIHRAHHVVAHAARQPRQRLGNGRGAHDHEPSRLDERLDVDVDRAFRDARHRDDHVLRRSTGRIARVRSNRHQPAAPRRQGVERLLPDDLARARAADEPLHAAVGEDDRTIAEVRRHRRAPRDDGGQGKRLPFAA